MLSDNARTLCGEGSTEWSSVRPSVRSTIRLQLRRASAGLLLSAVPFGQERSIDSCGRRVASSNGAAAANVDSVTSTGLLCCKLYSHSHSRSSSFPSAFHASTQAAQPRSVHPCQRLLSSPVAQAPAAFVEFRVRISRFSSQTRLAISHRTISTTPRFSHKRIAQM